MRTKYFGDRNFYKRVLAISVPIMIQNGITNLVNVVDNVMVGTLGTEAMSGVSIVNQFIFIFNMIIFGAVAAAGIFTSQYYGKQDIDGVRYTFRIKIMINTAVAIIAALIMYFLSSALISTFLHGDGSAGDLSLTQAFGEEYLVIMLLGFLPYAISQAYASTLRETGDTVVPMVSSICAIATNCIFNAILIFGLFGLPALGVRGAAIATVISRFTELIILVIRTHAKSNLYTFIKGAYRSPKIPVSLLKNIGIKGFPLMANEVLWSFAVTLRNQCISTRGLDAVAAMNIQTAVFNVLNVVYVALGSSVAIIIGILLGSGKIEEAKETDKKLLVFATAAGGVMCLLQLAISPIFPLVYNTTPEIRSLATFMLAISAFIMPFNSFAISCYYTLRSGGMAFVTMLFDSVYMWVVTVPISLVLAHFTSLEIYILFPIIIFADIFKCLLGILLVKRGTWAQRLVTDK